MTFFFYPLEVIHPAISRTKVYTLLFTPLLLLVLIGMCSGIEYTTIYNYNDLWQHIGEFNVWFRLSTLTAMLFYSFSLFLVPYNWRDSSADKCRSPELSLTSLSEQLESNRTYVGESFKRNTGMTFVEYITNRRIGYVVEALKRDPERNPHELFNYVGYRQRSTAYRNFQKIMDMSPTEFVESLKK